MTRTRDVTTTTHHRLRPILLLVMGATCLIWGSPATAEDCGSLCTVTRNGLPTFRLVNTAGVQDWDLETSAFGVELAPASDSANTGALRVEHGADPNTLVIDETGRVGIGTTVPVRDLQINGTFPKIRLDAISAGAGLADLSVKGNTFFLEGNTGARIVRVDTPASNSSIGIADNGRVDLGTPVPSARLHVVDDARVEGDVALGSSRTLKAAFDAVDPAEVLAKLADLPVASWRYKTEDEAERHIGPFAEDFQRLFGLGDGETISVIDAQGVALAAIQGVDGRLDREVAGLRAGIASLTETNLRLASENADLRDRLETIEEVLGHLGAALSRHRQEPSE